MLISICVQSLDYTGLGGMDAGTKATWTYLCRPVKSRDCAQVRIRDPGNETINKANTHLDTDFHL